MSSPPGEGEPDADRRLQVVIGRAAALAVPWGWPDRLAVAGLGLLLAAVALPWGSAGDGSPMVLAQAGRPGLVVAGALVAVVTVVVHLCRATTSPHLPTVLGWAAALTALGSLLVREADQRPLPLLVPGRVAVLLGCAALVVAATALADRAGAPARAGDLEAVLQNARRRTTDAGSAADADGLAAEVLGALGRRLDRRGAWVVAALVCGIVGGLALTGPWWRSAFELTGPYLGLLDGGQAAVTVRSGADILGAARSWLVAATVLGATGVAVWTGGRRAAPVVALAGMVVAASGVAAWGSGQAGRSVVPVVAVVLGVTAVALALRGAWVGTAGRARAGSLLVAALGLLAVWPLDDRQVPDPVTDGPYQVVAGAEGAASGIGLADLRDGSPAVAVGAPDSYPVWVDGRPGVVAWVGDSNGTSTGDDEDDDGGGDQRRRPVLWSVDDGRVDVVAVGPASVPGDSVPVGFEDGTVLFRGRGDGTRLWMVDAAEAVTLPVGAAGDLPVLGPDSEVWIVTLPYRPQLGEDPETPGGMYVADVGALVDGSGGPEASPTAEWPERPELPAGTLEVLPGDGEGESDAFAVLEDRILALAADGTTRPVFGGAVDGACGLNGDAAANFVASGRLGLVAENEGRFGRGRVEVGRRGYVAVADYGPDPSIVPLWTATPAADGGLWVALPVAGDDGGDERQDRVGGRHLLARVTADGAVRVVDHPLPGIRFVTVNPDDGAVLLVDYQGRLLQLDDPDAATTPLPPPPDDCYREVPVVAPPASLRPIGAAPSPEPDAVLLDTAGTRLLARPSGSGTEIVLLPPGGGEQVVAALPGDVLAVAPDGAGGAWWLEATGATGDRDSSDTGGGDEADEVVAMAVHLRVDGMIERDLSLPVGSGPFPLRIATFGASEVPYVFDTHSTRPLETDRGIATQGDHRLRRIVDGQVEVVYDAPRNAPVLVDGESSAARGRALAVTTEGVVLSVEDGEVRRLVDDAFEPLVGIDREDAAERPPRPLPVHLAAATPGDEVPVVGDMVADPAAGGVLVAQDGLLARIGLDGSLSPVVQDPRLDGVDLHVLEGQVVLTDAGGQSFVLEMPA